MLNYTRMYIYRICHSRITIILVAVSLFFCIIDSYLLSNTFRLEKSGDADQTQESTENMTGTIQITIEIDPNTNEPLPSTQMTADYIINNILSSSYPFLCVMIFTALFFSSENENRYINNIPGLIYHKSDFYFSKYLTNIIITGGIVFAFSMISVLISFLFYPSGIVLDSFANIIKIVLAQIILLSGVSSTVVCITSIIKSRVVCLICTFLLVFQVPIAFLGFMIQTIFSGSLNIPSGLLKYFLIDVSNLTLSANLSSVFQFILTGIIYLMISTGCTFLFCKKRDFA